MKRSLLREEILKVIYEIEVADNEVDEVLAFKVEELQAKKPSFTEEDRVYLSEMTRGIVKTKNVLDEIIGDFSDDWPIDRMAILDVQILRLTLFEMYHMELPGPVAINEAVNLAKKYSTAQSGTFINGILGEVVRNQEMVEDIEDPSEGEDAE